MSRRSEATGPYVRLLEILRKNDNRSLDELCDILDNAFADRRSRQKKIAPSGLSQAVDSYAVALRSAQDTARLEEVLNQLAGDRSLNAAEVKAVANAYRGTATRFASKSDAIAAIRKRHQMGQRDIAKSAQVKEIF